MVKLNFLNRTSGVLPREGGQVMIVSVISFILLFIITVAGLISPTVANYKITSNGVGSKQSLFLSESGIEDATYRIRNNFVINAFESITLNGAVVNTNIVDDSLTQKTLTSTGNISSIRRISRVGLFKDDGIFFPYGVQIDNGGLELQNSSVVLGDVFSNGSVTGASINSIFGNVTSGGSTGLIDNIATSLSSRANTIQNASVGTDAFYANISNTTVNGSPCYHTNGCYPDVADAPEKSLPITDAMITEWKNAAVAGGTIGPGAPCVSGVYTMTAVALGSKRILCDVLLTGATNATISGHLWVVGKFTMNGSSTMTVGGSGAESFAMIVDNPANHITSSTASLTHMGAIAPFAGNNGTFLLLISMHDYLASGGTSAVTILNSITGSLIAYAGIGKIEVQQTASVAAAAAYKIVAQNNSSFGLHSVDINPTFPTVPVNKWRATLWGEI